MCGKVLSRLIVSYLPYWSHMNSKLDLKNEVFILLMEKKPADLPLGFVLKLGRAVFLSKAFLNPSFTLLTSRKDMNG